MGFNSGFKGLTSSAAAVRFVSRYRNIIVDDHARTLPLGHSDRVKMISSRGLTDVLMVYHSSEQETQRQFGVCRKGVF